MVTKNFAPLSAPAQAVKPVAAPKKPAAHSQTKPDNLTGCTDVPCKPLRKVTYVFQCITAADVKLPYVVAVDGVVIDAHAKLTKPLRVSSGRTTKGQKNVDRPGEFSVHVQAGSEVTLYLNTDARADRRTHPVYAVKPSANDVVVRITEKEGLHKDSDKPELQSKAPSKAASPAASTSAPASTAKAPTQPAAEVDEYTAVLTGDIWMKVSHKYTEAEAVQLAPAGTSAAVKAAVQSIYAGLKEAKLAIEETASDDQAARSLTVTFTDSENPKRNITGYQLLADGLLRAHPAGFSALFTAALEAGIKSLSVSSCWRPMLGSIAHRAGLGLDVSTVDGTALNRQELRNAFAGAKPTKAGNQNDKDFVSEAEITAFGEYEAAILASKKAVSERDAANVAVKQADEAVAKATKKVGAASTDPDKLQAAQAKLEAAQAEAKVAAERAEAAEQAAGSADKAQIEKGQAWNDRRDANEPNTVRQYRASLLKCSCVRQLFDPWFLDENTQDKQAPEPNMQRKGAEFSNEPLHAHHLHITVVDEKLL